ncbi:methyltransferase domain-containing protein [Aquirufa sp. TARAVU-A1A]
MAISNRFQLKNINQNSFSRIQHLNSLNIKQIEIDLKERGKSIFQSLNDPISSIHDDIELLEFERYKLPFKTVLNKNSGLVRTDPYVTPEYLNEFYTKHYRNLYRMENDSSLEVSANEALKFGYRVFSFVSNHISKEAKILDYGCGLGLFSIPFVLNGFTNYKGVDLGEDYINHGKNLGFNVYQNSIDDLIAKNEKFDLVITHHVLEHIPDINEFLSKVKLVLNDGGKFFIAVPGLINLPLAYDLLDFFQFPHCWSFTRSSLNKLLCKHGFSEIIGNEDIYSLFVLNGELGAMNSYNESNKIISYLSKIERSYRFRYVVNLVKKIKGIFVS